MLRGLGPYGYNIYEYVCSTSDFPSLLTYNLFLSIIGGPCSFDLPVLHCL
jgi:hypothetical protein